MKIIQIAPEFFLHSSGMCYSVPELCCELQALGNDVSIYSVAPGPKWKTRYPVTSFRADPIPFASAFRSSYAMYRKLKQESLNAQIFHSNLMWLAPNIYPEFARRGTPCKHIISPRGTLSEWSLSRSVWKKNISRFLGQNAALKNADLFHVTAEMEYQELRAIGIRQPIAIIPNGLTIPDENFIMQLRYPENSRKNLLFLGRIHPKKGVKELINVWQRISARFINWQLNIAGPLDGYALSLKRMVEAKKINNIFFCGELSGDEKWKAYANADLFVLPTYSENWGNTIAEAMACGIPVITTYGAPWKVLEQLNAGAWIPIGENALEIALVQYMSMSDSEREQIGNNGCRWARAYLSWHNIAEKMNYVYLYALGKVPLNDFIVID